MPNPIDTLISWFDPVAGMRRQQARKILQYYEAARPSRTHKNRRETGSGNSAVLSAGRSLREQARHLEQNYDLASGVLNTLVANIIGANGIGIEPQPRTADGHIDAELAKQIRELWRDWAQRPEVTWQHDWASAQRLLCRAWLRDGEVFGQILHGQSALLQHGTRVPLSLELLEADFVPMDLNQSSPQIVQGIEINTWGRPVAYHVYKENPTDTLSYRNLAIKRIPAGRVLHLANRNRIRQLRGVSIFANVLNRFDDLKDYEESERIAAKIAASMAAYIKKGAPDLYDPEPDGEPRGMQFRPGMIFDDLRPGEEIGTIDTSRPNPQLETYRSGQLKAIAAGTGPTYSSISKTYDGTYSAQRQELVEGWSSYAILGNEFISRILQPVYREFINAAQSARLLDVRGIVENTLDDALYIPPQMPWIDPLKEVEAWKAMEESAYISGPEIIRKRGANPADVLEQEATWQELKRERDLAGPDGIKPSEREAERQAEQEQREMDRQYQEERRDDEREIADAQVQRIRAQAASEQAQAALREAEAELAKTNEELASAEFRKTLAQTAAIQADQALAEIKQQSERDYAELRQTLATAEHELRLEAISAEISAKEQEAEAKLDAWQRAEEHADQLRRVELQKRTAERDAALADYQATQAALAELTHGAGD